ncbi:MAG: hypothetical protein DWI58_00060 [Chloroflexi bacterium]|nr:MAG: hypothetical protein DWI58_00060 [Chloroflexota bacterium]
MTSPTAYLCWVCNIEETQRILLEICSGCGNLYHLNPYNSVPGRDCGDAWIDDDEMVLQVFCKTCMDEARSADAAEWVSRGARQGFPLATPPAGTAAAAAAAAEQRASAPQSTPPTPRPVDSPPPIRPRATPKRRFHRVD